MKPNRAIPVDLDDWLKSFRSSLESHPFPREITAGYNHAGEQKPDGSKASSIVEPSNNMVMSFAV